MANLFSRSVNLLPLKIVAGLILLGGCVISAVTYYGTNKYTNVGYQPVQPVSFDHSLHATQLGMDCRYCHSFVELGATSNIPATQVCMNCHKQVQKDNPKLAPLRESWETGKPVPWVKIHQAPDYVYFNHSVHVNRGVSCVSCHGQVNQMPVVYQHEPQSMGWCLECHRNPEYYLRPKKEVFNLDWQAPKGAAGQKEQGLRLKQEWKVEPPQNCSGCHR